MRLTDPVGELDHRSYERALIFSRSETTELRATQVDAHPGSCARTVPVTIRQAPNPANVTHDVRDRPIEVID